MSDLRVLQPGDQPLLEAFLLPRLAESMILLGNSRAVGLEDRGEFLHGTYVAAFDDGAISAVVAHAWNGNLVLQTPHSAELLCRAVLRATGRPLAGMLGPNAQVAAALAGLRIAPAELQLDSIELLYALDLAVLRVPAALRDGSVRVRRGEPGDVAQLARLRAEYNIEALHEPDVPELIERSRESEARAVHQRRVWLALHDGAIVATTGFNATIAEAVQIGGVFTPVPLRSRGYARAAVAQSLLDARADGARTAVLFTGDDNPAAQRAYEALGFERVGDYRISMLNKARTV
jgi:RimJ/RimL family protein N-acetyltransferase